MIMKISDVSDNGISDVDGAGSDYNESCEDNDDIEDETSSKQARENPVSMQKERHSNIRRNI